MGFTSWELWSCAHQVIRHHGRLAPIFVARRIDELVAVRNDVGTQMWKHIAEKVQQILSTSAPRA